MIYKNNPKSKLKYILFYLFSFLCIIFINFGFIGTCIKTYIDRHICIIVVCVTGPYLKIFRLSVCFIISFLNHEFLCIYRAFLLVSIFLLFFVTLDIFFFVL